MSPGLEMIRAFRVSCGTRLAPRNSKASITCPLGFTAGAASCFGVSNCDSGPSDREREMQQRIAKDWARLFGGEYDLIDQWMNISAGIPDLIALFRPAQSLVVIELKVVH